jgi:hypothetical protein
MLRLARLASDAVDAPKTGVQVEVPSDCRISKPEWARDEHDETLELADKPDTLLQVPHLHHPYRIILSAGHLLISEEDQ